MQNAKCKMLKFPVSEKQAIRRVVTSAMCRRHERKTYPLYRFSRLTRNVQILRECAVFLWKSGCNSVKYGHLSEIADPTLTRRVKLT